MRERERELVNRFRTLLHCLAVISEVQLSNSISFVWSLTPNRGVKIFKVQIHKMIFFGNFVYRNVVYLISIGRFVYRSVADFVYGYVGRFFCRSVGRFVYRSVAVDLSTDLL